MDKKLTIRKDLALTFGDENDGVIGLPGLTEDNHVIEISYFFGQTRPKNIIVVSSQAGCPFQCSFCELGSERFVRNLTAQEIRDQALLILEEARRHGFDIGRTHHKLTVANSGEPLLNPQLTEGLELLAHLPLSFKVSTIFPDSRSAFENLHRLADFAAWHSQPVQLQISLISTSEEQRARLSGGRVANFQKIRRAGEMWLSKNAAGRKVNLSLILTSEMSCDVGEIAAIFPPEVFRFRFREYVPTANGHQHGLDIIESPRLAQIKQEFSQRGYNVGHWASPSPIEWRFGLASNSIRRMYLGMVENSPLQRRGLKIY